MGLLPVDEQVAALRCRPLVDLLRGVKTLWTDYAAFWLQKLTHPWNLGVSVLFSSEFRFTEARLSAVPPHWRLALKAWRQLKLSLDPDASSSVVTSSSGQLRLFFNPLIKGPNGGSLKSVGWLPLAEAGIHTVQHALDRNRADDIPTALSRKLRALLRFLPPAFTTAEGPRPPASHGLEVFVGWPDSRGDWTPLLAKASSTRLLRRRLWNMAHGDGTVLSNFMPRRCWQRTLGPGFDWGLAFSRLSRRKRPPLNRLHCDIVFKALHGTIMSNRPFGHWGRPQCPNCDDDETDTDHCLTCPHHAAALQWLWDVTEHLSPDDPIQRSSNVLLGGAPPSDSLRGFGGRAYVWEVLRVAFLSALYRIWTRASISVQHEGGRGLVRYEARHIVLSAIANARVVARLDARRASHGTVHVLRDGSTASNERFRAFFEASWLASSWAVEAGPRLSTTFPIPINLDGLVPYRFPARRPSAEPQTGFLY
jgi:hypothetical protein